MSHAALSTPQKVVEYIGYSSAALNKAAAAIGAYEQQQQKIAALIPAAVDACVANGRIEPHQKQAMADALRDPVKTIELLTKLAAHPHPADVQRLGTSASQDQTKVAGARPYNPANSVNSAVVGGRDSRLKQSDIVFYQKLGLPVPTE